MASPTETNSERDGELGENIRRLTRRVADAHAAPQADAGTAEPLAREAPKLRGRMKPRVARRAAQIAALARRNALSPRPLLFALLPIALVIGAILYVAGGSIMSTENAYVQADMVNVSTDISGIVGEIAV